MTPESHFFCYCSLRYTVFGRLCSRRIRRVQLQVKMWHTRPRLPTDHKRLITASPTCLPSVCVECVSYSSVAPVVVPAPIHKTPLPPRSSHPCPVNTDYVCGFPQTLFVKLRILQQNIFGDKCCTVFVSSIFVYCYFEENNIAFFSFLVFFFSNFMFIDFKKMLHVT